MQTLSDLKRNAHKYEWALISNSWYQSVPEFQAAYRRVSRVQSGKLALLTRKDGRESDSWIDFPKASELSIQHQGLSVYHLTIRRACENSRREIEYHTMEYKLRPVFELFEVA